MSTTAKLNNELRSANVDIIARQFSPTNDEGLFDMNVESYVWLAGRRVLGLCHTNFGTYSLHLFKTSSKDDEPAYVSTQRILTGVTELGAIRQMVSNLKRGM